MLKTIPISSGIGVRDNRRKRNTSEILNDNDEVIRERNRVLDKWKNDFSEFLNPNSKSAADTDSIDLTVKKYRRIRFV